MNDSVPLKVVSLAFAAAFCIAQSALAAPPNFTQDFTPSTIGPGSTSQLRFTITNPNSTPVDNLAFTNSLPAGITLSGAPAALTDCLDATLTATPNGDTITFSDGGVPAFDSCTVLLNVIGNTVGTTTNTSGDLTSDEGNSGPSSADLTVTNSLPGFSKSFSPASVAFGGRSRLTFSIDNTANAANRFNPSFEDFLPRGMTVASPANAVVTGITGPGITTLTAAPGTNIIRLVTNNMLINASTLATVSVDVIGDSVGILENTSNGLFSSSGGALVSAGSASAALEVRQPARLALRKEFIDDPVAPGETIQLQYTLTNLDRNETASGITFTDDLDDALSGLAATVLPSTPCGAGSSIAGAGLLTFSGGSLAPEESCSFSVTLQVPSAANGAFDSITSVVEGEIRGSTVTGEPAEDTLFVAPIPKLAKEFIGSPALAGDDIVLRFTIDNRSATSQATDIAFIDELTTFLPFPVSASLPTDPCGVGSSISLISVTTDTQALSLSGGTLSAGDSCTFDVTLSLPESFQGGNYTNTTGEITATVDGQTLTGLPASASFDVLAAPVLTKSFSTAVPASGGTATLEFTLSHNDASLGDATDISFSDDLSSVLTGLVATSLPPDGFCGTGSSLTGSGNLTFSGGTLAPGESCTFSVEVTVPAGSTPGIYTNTISDLSCSINSTSVDGPSASADLEILDDTPAPIQLSKEFIAATGDTDGINPGDAAILRFTIENTDSTQSATNISFSDSLENTLTGLVSTSGILTDICGTGSFLTGTSQITFSGGSLSAGETCTFDVDIAVPALAELGNHTNTTSNVQAIFGGGFVSFPSASADLPVVAKPASELLTVEINQKVGQADPTNIEPILFTAVFSESVSGFEDGDVFLDGRAGLSGATAVVTEVAPMDGTTYEVSVSGMGLDGPVIASIPAGVANGTSQTNLASTSTDNSVFYELCIDLAPPTLTLLGDAQMSIILDDPFVDPGFTVSDDCDASPTVVVGGDTVDPSTIGTYAISYTATDATGKISSLIRTVRVIPRFASIEGIVGCNEVTIEKEVSINGSILSQRKVDIKEMTTISGNVSAVEEKAIIGENTTIGGDVAAGDDIEVKKEAAITGNATSGEDVNLEQDSSVGGDATAAGDVDLNSGAVVLGTITEGAAVPPLPDVPLPMLDLNTGGADVELDKNETLALAPGNYGKLEAKEGSTLQLAAGTYGFEEIKVEKKSTIEFDLSSGFTIVNVKKKIELKEEVEMTASGGDATGILFQVEEDEVVLENDGTYIGTFLAPAGEIKLEKDSTLNGALVGEKVVVKENVVVDAALAIDPLIEASADWDSLLLLPLLGSSSTPFQQWLDLHDISTIGDDDLDGIPNVVEFVLALDPLSPDSLAAPSLNDEGELEWKLELRRELDTFFPVVEVSEDMISWAPTESIGLNTEISQEVLSVTGKPANREIYLRLGVRESAR